MILAPNVQAAWEEGFDAGYMEAKRRFLDVIAQLAPDEVVNAVLKQVGRSIASERAEAQQQQKAS